MKQASAQLSLVVFIWEGKTERPRRQTLTYLILITNTLMIKEMTTFLRSPTFFHLSASTFVPRIPFSGTWVSVSACSYRCVCVLHACTRFEGRGIEESEKESERLETGWGMTGWIWLRVWNGWKGLWCRTFSIEHSWVQAGAGSTTPGRPLPEGPSVKKAFSEQTAGRDSHLSSFLIEDDPLIPANNESCGCAPQCRGPKGQRL